MSDDKPIAPPLMLGPSRRALGSVREALDALTLDWPTDARGPRHEDAVAACLKVLDGHRSTPDAVSALCDAAAEAGLSIQIG